MSIPTEIEERHFQRFALPVRMAPLIVALILAALWLIGAPPSMPDLVFSAPIAAPPGAPVALRAWHVDRIDYGETIIRAPEVSVELRNERGQVIAMTELRKSFVQGREGELTLPAGFQGEAALVARAKIDGQMVTVQRPIHIGETRQRRKSSGRQVNAFQVYELGPLRIADRRRAPRVLDPRVEGGACVPELVCWLSVWVGDQPARVRVQAVKGVRIERPMTSSGRWFLRFPVVVASNEALLDLEALDDEGAVLAARQVRLPIVPGGISARVLVDEERDRVGLEWEQLGGRMPVLVDVFRRDRWTYATSLPPDDPWLPVDLGPGVWRFQARAGLFSNNTAGVAYAVVPDPEGPKRVRLAADAILAQADRGGLDPLAMAIVEGQSFDTQEEDALQALFAVPSFDVMPTSAGMSSRIGVDERQERQQERLRWVAAAAIFLIGWIVSMVLLRVELAARARARALLEGFDDRPHPARRSASLERWLWAFVFLVFVLIAALALSKGWF